MISSLQPHLVLASAATWAGIVLAVAALAGMGYAWRWHIRPRGNVTRPPEASAAAAEPPAPPEEKAEQEAPIPPAWVDDVTGLPDLGYLQQKFRATQQELEPLTLLTIRVEGRRGDRPTGSGPGDRALVEVAHTVRSILRAGDTCVRSTTGQLMAVLPGLDADTSASLVTRVRHAVESLRLVTRSGGEIRLAVTVGRACVPQDGMDLDTLLDAARKDVDQGREPGGSSPSDRLCRALPIIPN